MMTFLLLSLVAVSANITPRFLATTAVEMPEISATYSGAKFTISGKAELADDNLVANNDNAVTIPVKVEPEAISDVSLTVTTKMSLVTGDECALTTKMAVEITVQLALPKDFVDGVDVLKKAVSAAPSGADLTKAHVFTVEIDGGAPPAGVSLSVNSLGRASIELDVSALAETSSPDLYAVLALSGSNILIKSDPIILRKAGFEVPLSFDVIILDPDLMKIPVESACKSTLTKDTSLICEADGTGFATVACQAMCKAANTLLDNKPALSIKGIDIFAPLYEVSKDITKYTYKDSDDVLYVFTVGTNEPCSPDEVSEELGDGAASSLYVSFIVLLAAVMAAVNVYF